MVHHVVGLEHQVGLGAILPILYSLIRHLAAPKMHLPLHPNHAFDFLLLRFYFLELTPVPIVDTENIVFDTGSGPHSHVIEIIAVLVLDKLLSISQVFLCVHMIRFEIVHFIDELVSPLHFFDSSVSALLFLL